MIFREEQPSIFKTKLKYIGLNIVDDDNDDDVDDNNNAGDLVIVVKIIMPYQRL